MSERFAIYYAPSAVDPLWERAALWLGRDPSGAVVPPIEIGELDVGRRMNVTGSARRYGFHATLKAPMTLAAGCTNSMLTSTMTAFADSSPAIAIGRLKLAVMDGFVALVPEAQSVALTDFALRCVTDFEPFRAPLGEAALRRRLGGHLTARQTELLHLYGYPYVAEEFRFHMTLTDRLATTDVPRVLAAAEHWFGPLLQRPYTIDRVVLFHEPAPGAAFIRLSDHELNARASDGV